MSKTIEIKKVHVKNLIISLILGFIILYILEHLGNFSYNHKYSQPYSEKPSLSYEIPSNTKVTYIKYETYFENIITTEGNGFTLYDLNYKNSEFNNYSTKSYYYLQATIKDYIYGIYLTIFLFILTLLITNFKIKFT